MEIYIDNQIIAFESELQNIKEILESINNQLEKTGLYISYLILDDVPVYVDFLNYLGDNVDTLQKIEVITQTLNQAIVDSLRLSNEHITKMIPSINELAKEFYHSSSDESWLTLIDLLETLEWTIQTFRQLNAKITKSHSLYRYGAWKEFANLVSELEKLVPKIEEAINSEENKVT